MSRVLIGVDRASIGVDWVDRASVGIDSMYVFGNGWIWEEGPEREGDKLAFRWSRHRKDNEIGTDLRGSDTRQVSMITH